MGLIIDCYLTIATRRKRGRSAVYGPCGCIQGSGTAVELTPGDGLSAKLKSSIRALKLTCTIKRSENSNQREVWCKIKKILAGWTWHSWRLGCTTIAGQLLLIKKTAMREGEKERKRERERERRFCSHARKWLFVQLSDTEDTNRSFEARLLSMEDGGEVLARQGLPRPRLSQIDILFTFHNNSTLYAIWKSTDQRLRSRHELHERRICFVIVFLYL